MNLKLVGNSVSNVVLVLGVLMLIPLGVSLIYGESDAWAFAVSAAITTSCGFVGAKFTRSPEGRFGHREGFAITTFGWLAAAVFGALPFLFYGTFGTVVDAVFEAMSGLTTTGATVLGNIEAQPHGILFWRSFLHWLGEWG